MSGGDQHVFIMRDGDPWTYQEAMCSPHAKDWEKAVAVELEQLHTSRMFEWVPRVPDGWKVIGSQIVFQTKRDGDGKVVRYKVWVVAKGYSQVPGQDFTATFASIACLTMLQTLCRWPHKKTGSFIRLM